MPGYPTGDRQSRRNRGLRRLIETGEEAQPELDRARRLREGGYDTAGSVVAAYRPDGVGGKRPLARCREE